MTEVFIGAIFTAALIIGVFIAGLTSGRARSAREDLDEWEGVLDVKRETRDKLNDPYYVERVQDEFNDK